jgi:hypothetical protein
MKRNKLNLVYAAYSYGVWHPTRTPFLEEDLKKELEKMLLKVVEASKPSWLNRLVSSVARALKGSNIDKPIQKYVLCISRWRVSESIKIHEDISRQGLSKSYRRTVSVSLDLAVVESSSAVQPTDLASVAEEISDKVWSSPYGKDIEVNCLLLLAYLDKSSPDRLG